jgi:hypothetical protein
VEGNAGTRLTELKDARNSVSGNGSEETNDT